MKLHLLPFLLLTFPACTVTGDSGADDSGVGNFDDTDSGDTDDTDDTDDTGDEGCPADSSDATWVVEGLEVIPAGEGADWDGDDQEDNAGAVFAQVIAEAIVESHGLGIELVVQFWDVDDWCNDDDVMGGMASVSDTDGDPADNYDGDEDFAGGDNVDVDGHALNRAALTIEDSLYGVELPPGEFDIGSFHIEAVSPVFLGGTADQGYHAGAFGFAMTKRSTREMGVDTDITEDEIDAMLDYDSDGDGAPDALTIQFTFSAVSATIQ